MSATMNSSSTIIWRVIPDEHVRAVRALQQYHSQHERRLTRELRVAGLVLLALAGAGVIAWRWLATRRPPVELFVAIGIPAALGALYLATRPLAVKRAARNQLLDNPLALQERHYTFDARGIRIAGETFTDTFAWREVRHIAETPEFFLIFAQRSAYYLPKRAIVWPETLEGVRDVFVDALGERALVR
jgi:hypothetical protein